MIFGEARLDGHVSPRGVPPTHEAVGIGVGGAGGDGDYPSPGLLGLSCDDLEGPPVGVAACGGAGLEKDAPAVVGRVPVRSGPFRRSSHHGDVSSPARFGGARGERDAPGGCMGSGLAGTAEDVDRARGALSSLSGRQARVAGVGQVGRRVARSEPGRRRAQREVSGRAAPARLAGASGQHIDGTAVDGIVPREAARDGHVASEPASVQVHAVVSPDGVPAVAVLIRPLCGGREVPRLAELIQDVVRLGPTAVNEKPADLDAGPRVEVDVVVARDVELLEALCPGADVVLAEILRAGRARCGRAHDPEARHASFRCFVDVLHELVGRGLTGVRRVVGHRAAVELDVPENQGRVAVRPELGVVGLRDHVPQHGSAEARGGGAVLVRGLSDFDAEEGVELQALALIVGDDGLPLAVDDHAAPVDPRGCRGDAEAQSGRIVHADLGRGPEHDHSRVHGVRRGGIGPVQLSGGAVHRDFAVGVGPADGDQQRPFDVLHAVHLDAQHCGHGIPVRNGFGRAAEAVVDDGVAHPEPGLAGRLVAVDVNFAHGGVHVVVGGPGPVVDHLVPERVLAVGQGGVESGEPQGPLGRDAGLAPGLLALAGPPVLRVEEGDGPHLELVRPGEGDARLPGRGLGLQRIFVRGGLQQQGGVQARLHDAAPVQLEHPARAVALRAGEGDPGPGRGVPDEEARRVGPDVRPGEDQRQLGLAALAPAVGGDLHDRVREGFRGVLGLQALEELGVRARQVAHAHHGDRQVRSDEDPVPVGVHRVLANLHSRELVGHELDAVLAERHQRVVAHGERDLVHGLHRGVADGEARVPLVEEEPGGRRALDEARPAAVGGRQDHVRAAVLGRVERHAGVLLVGRQEARVAAHGARADERPVVLQRQDGVLVAEHVEVPVDAREGELGRRHHRHRVLLDETELGAALALLRLHPEVGGDPGHLDGDVPLVGHQDPPLLDVVDPQLDGEHLADRDGAVPLALQAHLPEEADALALDALRDRVDLGGRREEEEVGRLVLVGLQDLAAHHDVLVRVVGPEVPENDLGGGDRPLHVQVRVLRVRVQLGDLPQVQVAEHVEVVLLDRVPRPCGVAAAASVTPPRSERGGGGRVGVEGGKMGSLREDQVLRAVPPREPGGRLLAPSPPRVVPLGGPRLPPRGCTRVAVVVAALRGTHRCSCCRGW